MGTHATWSQGPMGKALEGSPSPAKAGECGAWKSQCSKTLGIRLSRRTQFESMGAGAAWPRSKRRYLRGSNDMLYTRNREESEAVNRS